MVGRVTDLAESSDVTAGRPTGDLRAVLHYRVDGELWVKDEQLGSEWSFERESGCVTLALPTPDASSRKASSWPRRDLPASRMGEEGSEQLVCVSVVQVTVDLGRGLGDEGSGNAEMVLFREADEIATSAVRALLDWARTEDGQHWLPAGHERPELEWDAWLETADELRVYVYPFRHPRGIVLHSAGATSRMGDFERMDPAVLAGEIRAPGAESLLADAGRAVWPTLDPDSARAVLLAAIALETKTPEALRRVAGAAQQELLELLLANYEEVPTSVKFQLSQVADRVCRRSLEQDDGDLFKRVKKLYELRNDVAHRGVVPEVGNAREAVSAARDAFAWLDGLTPGDPTDSA
jgi:hypothetical protein